MTSFSADHFSECVESHAFSTYDKFLKAQGGMLVALNVNDLNFLLVNIISEMRISL